MLNKKKHFVGDAPVPRDLGAETPLFSGQATPMSPNSVDPYALPRASQFQGLVPADDALPDIGGKMHPKPYGPGTLDYLAGFFLNGDTPEMVRREFAAYAEQQRRLAQRHALEMTIDDPTEYLTYVTNPEEWAKSRATNYGKTVASEGQVIDRPGYAPTKIEKTPNPLDPKDMIDSTIRQSQLALERAKLIGSDLNWYDARSRRIAAQKQPASAAGQTGFVPYPVKK